jgi:signal transduction histidine kinase
MNTLELRPETVVPPADPAAHEGLGAEVLLQNARWFTHIRWVAIGLLLAGYGVARGWPWLLRQFGLSPPGHWPLLLALPLTVLNLAYVAHLRLLDRCSPRWLIELNLWVQVVADLLAVTFLVHSCGSTETFAAFTYLFHVILACVFFPPRRSLIVTSLAGAFYLGSVLLELAGTLPPPHILPAHTLTRAPAGWVAVSAVSAVGAWLVIWYLVSTLSERVRERDIALTEANARLQAADVEIHRRVLQVTHDLKAPFCGIEGNVQLIRFMHWGRLTPEVKELIAKVEARSHALRERINDILALGQLRPQDGLALAAVPLRPVVDDVLQDIAERASARHLRLDVAVPEVAVQATPDALRVILLNLASNAVSYSHEGGRVAIVATAATGLVKIAVQDDGIGISAEVLPRIFEEYYRGGEAKEMNRESTGLGLSIVREAASRIGAVLRVTSEPGRGSTFEVLLAAADLPAPRPAAVPA